MFDGLKKKLNSFRENVEDTAEEKAEAQAEAEEAAADATDADTETETPDAETHDADATEAVGGENEPTETTADSATVSDADDATSETEVETADAQASSASDSETPKTADESGDAADDSAADEAASSRERLASDAANEALESGQQESSGAGRLKRAAAFATGKVIIEEEDLEDPLWELEMALLESDVEMHVAEEILDTIREKMVGETRRQVETMGQLVQEALHDALYDVISVGQFDFDQRIAEADKPVTLIFTGVNGVGKTTSIAKMARYFEKQGLSVVLANGDTYRAGANEQIRKHAENLDTKIISHEQGGDPAAVIYDAVEYAEAHDIDVVLGDTAGRLHTSNDLMAQLEKIDRVVEPDLTLFVDEAVAGQDAVERAKQFNEAAEIDGAVLTKADADSNGGAAISIAYVTGKPILFLGVGQGYDDIEQFDPERMVERLLGEDE
ncbi:signal recognition particle-docking protein FtsY [Halogeometricum borinquense]|uniref:Signal recognition particle receptor FtsY n=1 Tax=Halogeometricum borinquense TaxID=60847 RepID=A0A6C0UC76_9EURY|nr:signal recognition particle-docking protein FtsY [Halogeometricum borinquense]QIB72886.1 signal recognition particle-docking protein FtsY [Halogeometricum borinquense]QIQ75155.1 signal recognition particle-docking protein FtsY [Halogeometricum borinquense]